MVATDQKPKSDASTCNYISFLQTNNHVTECRVNSIHPESNTIIGRIQYSSTQLIDFSSNAISRKDFISDSSITCPYIFRSCGAREIRIYAPIVRSYILPQCCIWPRACKLTGKHPGIGRREFLYSSPLVYTGSVLLSIERG